MSRSFIIQYEGRDGIVKQEVNRDREDTWIAVDVTNDCEDVKKIFSKI